METNQKFIRFEVNRGLLTTGAALTGIGAFVGLVGTALVSAALISAGRGWMKQLDTTPAERAARALHQARVASLAGMEAWRSESNASAN